MAVRKLQIVLDLDETLIHYMTAPEWLLVPEDEKAKYEIHTPFLNGGTAVLRPNFKEFLNYIFENCVVSIFTYAPEDYAQEIASVLTDGHPEKFANIWSFEVAEYASNLLERAKDLRYLWYNLNPKVMTPCNTILIDDLDENTNNDSNRNNAIQIQEFRLLLGKSKTYNDLSNDKALLNVMGIIKNILDDRPTFKNRPRAESIFTSLQKAPSIQNGGQQKRRTLKQRQRKGTTGSRVHLYKS